MCECDVKIAEIVLSPRRRQAVDEPPEIGTTSPEKS